MVKSKQSASHFKFSAINIKIIFALIVTNKFEVAKLTISTPVQSIL